MKILICDDEIIAVEDLKDKLLVINPSFTIITFTNGEKALSYLKDNEVDIIFLDIRLGAISGVEMAKTIRASYSKVPIIFLTAYSEYAIDAFKQHASGYLMKPATIEEIKTEVDYILAKGQEAPRSNKIKLKTFGNFDVFDYNNMPLSFSRAKSKELLAYLVDKHGSSVTNKEICAILFEDKAYSRSLQKQIQVIISSLLKTLEEANMQDLIIKQHNSLSINTSLVDCDSYRAIEGDRESVLSFMGEYLNSYSWAELSIEEFYLRREAFIKANG